MPSLHEYFKVSEGIGNAIHSGSALYFYVAKP